MTIHEEYRDNDCDTGYCIGLAYKGEYLPAGTSVLEYDSIINIYFIDKTGDAIYPEYTGLTLRDDISIRRVPFVIRVQLFALFACFVCKDLRKLLASYLIKATFYQ